VSSEKHLLPVVPDDELIEVIGQASDGEVWRAAKVVLA